MKKYTSFILILLSIFALSACNFASVNLTELSSKDSMAVLSYLSSGFIDEGFSQTTMSTGLVTIADTETTEIENELEEVNLYVDKLKALIDGGLANFGNVEETVSDNPLYQFMITFTIDTQVFNMYYNVDPVTTEISGILVIDSVEYEFVVESTLEDSDDLYDDDDDDDEMEDDDDDEYEDEEEYEDDDEVTTTTEDNVDGETSATPDETASNGLIRLSDSEDFEEKMVFTAYNGEDFVKVEYKVENEETKLEMTSHINGITKELSLKIEQEDDELKIEIEDGENSYTFKHETEDGQNEYKLEYEVNGVEGEVKVYETQNELGETVYVYEIEEEGHHKEVEHEDPDNDDDEQEDEEDESEEA